MPVRRFCARLGIPPSTWYYWRAGQLPAAGPALAGAGRRRDRGAGGRDGPTLVGLGPPQDLGDAPGRRGACPVSRSSGRSAGGGCSCRCATRPSGGSSPARRAVFLAPPTRRNRVWQMDFTEFETAGGGTWRIAGVVDYATKVCLAAPGHRHTAARDAISASWGDRGAETALGLHSSMTASIRRPASSAARHRDRQRPGIQEPDFAALHRRADRSWRHVRTRHHAPRPTASSSASTARSSTSTCTARDRRRHRPQGRRGRQPSVELYN